MQQQPQLPPGAAPGPMTFVRNPMVQPPQRLQWQVRHAQEVTLQQRGPMGMGGPPMMVGGLQRLPMGAGMIAAPMPLSEPHSVMGRQEPTPPPGSQAPAPLNVPPMTPPPENPQSEDDKQKVSFCKIYYQLCILLGKYARILLFQFVFTKYVFGFRNYDRLIFVVFDVIFQNVIMRKYDKIRF